MLRHLAQLCYRHRWATVAAWIVLLVGCFAISGAFGGESRTEFSLPGSETQEAIELLSASGFGDRTGIQGQVVIQSDTGLDDPAIREPFEALLARIDEEVPDTSIISPFSQEGQRQISQDGTIAYAEVNLAERHQEGYIEAGDEIKAMREDVALPAGAQLELGGDIFAEFSEPSSEIIGIGAAMIILLVAFGSVLAMGFPIITALFGVGTGIALTGLVANVIATPDFTPAAAAMIGIGVGIDYALFIITRFRQGLHDGLDSESAVMQAVDTAGRAVVFAGITVVISVCGLLAMNLDTFRAVAAASALAVLMTMLSAVTLLPALLGFARERIDRFGLPHRKRAEGETRTGFWQRWSQFIQRHPWPPLLAGLALLLILSLPILDLRLGFTDAGNRVTTDTTRRAYDLLSTGFGPGFNSPLLLVADLENGQGIGDFEALTGQLNGVEGVAYASPPQPNPDGTAAISIVVPSTAPQDEATTELVERLREDVIPQAVDGSGTRVLVGGAQAGVVDFVDYTSARMPLFLGAVLVLSFILLMAVFRSLLVPLKAVIMNLLSLSASFGVIVAVFQWGWAKEIVGIGTGGPIEAWAPLMIFAIVFGLSMDYEVFLLSRIREEYDRTGDNGTAVATGLASTARVITAAAAIMICVFSSFVLGHDRALKLLGFGMATAVFIDATIVRMVLVPATMELLGDRNWWLPGWLHRILPNVTVESSHAHAASVPVRPALESNDD